MISLKNIVENIFYHSLMELAKEKQIDPNQLKDVVIRIEKAREEKFGDYACTSA